MVHQFYFDPKHSLTHNSVWVSGHKHAVLILNCPCWPMGGSSRWLPHRACLICWLAGPWVAMVTADLAVVAGDTEGSVELRVRSRILISSWKLSHTFIHTHWNTLRAVTHTVTHTHTHSDGPPTVTFHWLKCSIITTSSLLEMGRKISWTPITWCSKSMGDFCSLTIRLTNSILRTVPLMCLHFNVF